ncbi:MAG TPA: hypothetical protein VFC37_00025 [Terracidiphilus sp.]|nr:hypothetical protein [Terracidiphilus sp.]
MAPYKFLIDNDCSSAARYFPKKRVITLQQAKLAPNTPDADVFVSAYELWVAPITLAGVLWLQLPVQILRLAD